MTTQPPLPAPVLTTDIEQAYIDETPQGLFPINQDSNFGLHRKIFCDILTDVENQLQTLYNEHWPSTSQQFLSYHEYQVGLPTNIPGSIQYRQSLVLLRYQRGPWTDKFRRSIIEFFIVATFGTPPVFGTGGLPLTSGGVPLYSFPGSVTSYYKIVDDIPNFKYHVWIDNTVGVDYAVLARELGRVTPAGLQFDISTMYQKTGGAKSSGKGGGGEVH